MGTFLSSKRGSNITDGRPERPAMCLKHRKVIEQWWAFSNCFLPPKQSHLPQAENKIRCHTLLLNTKQKMLASRLPKRSLKHFQVWNWRWWGTWLLFQKVNTEKQSHSLVMMATTAKINVFSEHRWCVHHASTSFQQKSLQQ